MQQRTVMNPALTKHEAMVASHTCTATMLFNKIYYFKNENDGQFK